MLFADDSYLYYKASEEEAAMKMLRLLQTFENASGKKVNLLKSLVSFSTNVTHLCNVLRMEEAGEDRKYLGLRNMMQKSKVATLGFLKDKVKSSV